MERKFQFWGPAKLGGAKIAVVEVGDHDMTASVIGYVALFDYPEQGPAAGSAYHLTASASLEDDPAQDYELASSSATNLGPDLLRGEWRFEPRLDSSRVYRVELFELQSGDETEFRIALDD